MTGVQTCALPIYPVTHYNTGNDYLGGRWVNSLYTYQGYLDDIAIWNKQLNGTDVESLYFLGTAVFENSEQYLSTANTQLSLEYTTDQRKNLLNFYAESHGTGDVGSIDINDTEWYYEGGLNLGYAAGDSWENNGFKYIQTDHGILTTQSIPEASVLLYIFLGILAFCYKKSRIYLNGTKKETKEKR